MVIAAVKTMTYASISYVYARPVLHFRGGLSSACSQDLTTTPKSLSQSVKTGVALSELCVWGTQN